MTFGRTPGAPRSPKKDYLLVTEDCKYLPALCAQMTDIVRTRMKKGTTQTTTRSSTVEDPKLETESKVTWFLLRHLQ